MLAERPYCSQLCRIQAGYVPGRAPEVVGGVAARIQIVYLNGAEVPDA